ncbi:ribonuclease H-like domain-containing protein [Tanacetum coccineum]
MLLAIPDEYLLKFHHVVDAKSLWEAIKSRFGGNKESKKMQKNVLKHQFENFSTASNKSLDKAYDRFQKLISQLEVHGAPISKEDINQKFLRSLHPSWNQIALIMRNKTDIDEIDIDDLHNNLRVYEDEMKSMLFLCTTNNSPQVKNEDFQQIDEDDLKELDLRWQVAMLTVRCYNCHRKGHFARECRSGRNHGKRSYGDNDRSNAPTNESSSQALSRWGLEPKEITWINVSKDSGSFMLKKVEAIQRSCCRIIVVDSGCSSQRTDNKAYLLDYEDYNRGFMAFGSEPKGDSEENQEYILLPLQPHRTRIPVEDVAPAAHEKPSESSPKDNDVQDSEDDKEGQHQMTEDEQVLHDDLEKMIAQEVVAKALDDATRQAFEEEKRNIASQKRAAQATSTNKLSTVRSYVSTATTPYVSAASTPTGANAGESSFVYLGGQIPIDASTLPNVDLPTDPNMPDLEDVSNAFPNDGNDSDILKSAVQTEEDSKGLSIQQLWRGSSMCTEFEDCYAQRFQMKLHGITYFLLGLHVKQQPEWNLYYQDKCVADILKKFQVTPKASHLNAVKRIFRYLKHQPKLGLWYPRDSPFELEAYSDSDYGGASLDRKSTTGGCQFIGRRLISWQCKKQTIMANSTTNVEYVAACNLLRASIMDTDSDDG